MTEAVLGQTPDKTDKGDIRERFKNPSQPSDFDTKENFLRYAVQLFDDDLEFDRKNREAAIQDLNFTAGDQWDDAVKQRRAASLKPTLTFNRLPAFIGQITGQRRLNETEIKVVADDSSFKDIAKLREGLIRNIQKTSMAEIAYAKAFENQVMSGLGNFEIALEYAYDDVFEQDAKIFPIDNPLAVVWDQGIQNPTGADAKHCFVVDTMKMVDFKREYPDARASDPVVDTQLVGYDIGADWVTKDEVRVIDFWRVRSRRRFVALLRDEDGTEDVEDVTDREFEEFAERIVTTSAGIPIMREVDRKFAELYTITALDILEGPYEMPISRVPIFRVPGWDINVGDKRRRFGLVRFLKDPQKLHNYWRSIIAEKLMMTPKGNWIATAQAVEGREKQWRESHLTDDPLLVWEGESGAPPVRVPPTQIEAGLIEQAGMAAQDLRDISNLHQASLGQQGNEVSGKGILARQRIGEIGTTIYQDNLSMAIEEAGKVLNELIPHVYDTARTIKILGAEGRELPPVVINDETDKNSVDITAGKYTVTSTTGPSFVSKRVEAAESMLNMVNAVPQSMAVALDKIVEAQDWPGASEIARRLRLTLPPGLLSEQDMTDEQKAASQRAEQQDQITQEKQDMVLAVELDEKQARAEQARALAMQAKANAAKALASIDIDEVKAISAIDEGRVKTVLEAAKLFDNIVEKDDIGEIGG